MATPTERVQDDLKTAMRAGDKERVSTLRMLLSELRNARIASGSEPTPEELWTVVRKGVKQRQESAEQYRAGGRAELADKEEREAEILAEYLPAAVSEEELRDAVRELVRAEGLGGPQDLGRVMGTLMPRYKGRVDGRELQRIVRDELG